MARRESQADKKKAAAAEAAAKEATAEATEGSGEEEETEETTSEAEGGDELLPDLDPDDPAPAAPDQVEAAASGGALAMGVPSGSRPCPNKPSFDWTREGKKLIPNIRKDQGEEITSETKVGGIKRIRTNQGRFIFLCTVKEYEKAVGEGLSSRELYLEHFPHAFE